MTRYRDSGKRDEFGRTLYEEIPEVEDDLERIGGCLIVIILFALVLFIYHIAYNYF